jgi:hypothetical protein
VRGHGLVERRPDRVRAAIAATVLDKDQEGGGRRDAPRISRSSVNHALMRSPNDIYHYRYAAFPRYIPFGTNGAPASIKGAVQGRDTIVMTLSGRALVVAHGSAPAICARVTHEWRYLTRSAPLATAIQRHHLGMRRIEKLGQVVFDRPCPRRLRPPAIQDLERGLKAGHRVAVRRLQGHKLYPRGGRMRKLAGDGLLVLVGRPSRESGNTPRSPV